VIIRQSGNQAIRGAVLVLLSGITLAGCKKKDAEAAAKAADSTQTPGSTVTLPVVGQEVRQGY
jgi:predicted lipoprotein